MNQGKNTTTLTKRIAITAILLAICIVSQFLKNLSVYITGPIVNLCLILAAMTVGLLWGVVLAIITPVTAFLITGAPIMAAVPGIIPLVMGGNAVLVVAVYFLFKPAITGDRPLVSARSIVTAVVSAALKAAFMGLTISLWVLPTFLPQAVPAESPLLARMGVFQKTYSLVQFTTALIGFVYFFILWTPLKKALKTEG